MSHVAKPVFPPLEADSWPIARQWSRLDDLCEGVFDCPHTTPVITDEGPYVVRSQDVRTGIFRLDQAAHVSEETYQERIARAEPRFGDILYSREGTYFGLAAEVPRGVRVCLGQRMVLIRPSDKIDTRFLRLWLNSPVLHRHIMGFRDGTVAERLNMPTIRGLPVPHISLSEQRAIAATLGALDEKIELNREMNATLDSMARALFRDWFVDFGPTRAKMEGRAPYLSPDLWPLFPDRLDAEGKPEGWEVRSVYDFANVVYGAPFASKQFNTDSAGIPLIRIRDLATHEPGVWTEEAHPKGHLIEPGDIVVGMDGEFRLHVWKGAPAWLNQRVCHFEPRPGVPTAFLAEALIEPLAFFERGKVGTTVIHLGKGDIDTFRLLHPGTELLSAFGEIAGSLIDATVKNATESRTLAQTRDLLLPRLMSGELRVAEAERLIGEVA